MLNHKEIAILEQANEILTRHGLNGIGINQEQTSDHFKSWYANRSVSELVELSNLQIICAYTDEYEYLFKNDVYIIEATRYLNKLFMKSESYESLMGEAPELIERTSFKIVFGFAANQFTCHIWNKFVDAFNTRPDVALLENGKLSVHFDILPQLYQFNDHENKLAFLEELSKLFDQYIAVRPLLLKSYFANKHK